MTLSSTITHTALNTDLDAHRATLLSNQQGNTRGMRIGTPNVSALVSGTALSKRSIVFTPNDTHELLGLYLDTYGHASATVTTTVALTALDDGAFFLTGSITKSQSTSNSTLAQVVTDYSSTTGTRYFLKKGYRYQLSVSSDDASNACVAVRGHILLGIERRRQ